MEKLMFKPVEGGEWKELEISNEPTLLTVDDDDPMPDFKTSPMSFEVSGVVELKKNKILRKLIEQAEKNYKRYTRYVMRRWQERYWRNLKNERL